MAEYRAYTVGRDGHFTGFEALICDNQANAIKLAQQLVDQHHTIELWSGHRFIQRFALGDSPPAVSHEIKDGRMVEK